MFISNRRDKSTLYCIHCHRFGHDHAACFLVHGLPDWWLDTYGHKGRVSSSFFAATACSSTAQQATPSYQPDHSATQPRDSPPSRSQAAEWTAQQVGSLALPRFATKTASTTLTMLSTSATTPILGGVFDSLQFHLSSQQALLGAVSLVFADGSAIGGPKLSYANGVWVDQRLPLKHTFKQVADHLYKADSNQVDFFNKATEVAADVNSWAEKQTNGLIKELVSPDSFDDETKLILANAIYFKVKVISFRLPRFKISFGFEASKILKGLGLELLFREGGFTEMTDSPEAQKLYVSGIKQKCFIEINEEGTEVAAATFAKIRQQCLRTYETLYFVADHPFMFLIRENMTGAVLFTGQVVNPLEN
uniref:Serpin domain-containing protein n=1 Tax=Chenopodium quinoa TaxID=63459 RepID=A0A803MGL0_CHEQI